MAKADDDSGATAKSVETDQMLFEQKTEKLIFKVYPERWWLLMTVVLLNLANYSHWVAFPSVAKNAAKYYDQVKIKS